MIKNDMYEDLSKEEVSKSGILKVSTGAELFFFFF